MQSLDNSKYSVPCVELAVLLSYSKEMVPTLCFKTILIWSSHLHLTFRRFLFPLDLLSETFYTFLIFSVRDYMEQYEVEVSNFSADF